MEDMARPASDSPETEVLQIRMTEQDKADWTAEANRLAQLAGRQDARGNLGRLIKVLLRMHLEQPARTRNKAAKKIK